MRLLEVLALRPCAVRHAEHVRWLPRLKFHMQLSCPDRSSTSHTLRHCMVATRGGVAEASPYLSDFRQVAAAAGLKIFSKRRRIRKTLYKGRAFKTR